MTSLLKLFSQDSFLFYLIALGTLWWFAAFAAASRDRALETRGSECVFLVAIGALLLAWRWPVLLYPRLLDPDEALFAAGALKTMVDFVPWRGFDGTSSGPLTTYVLTLPALLGTRIGFFSTRLIGICLTWVALVALYYAAKWTYGVRIARLCTVPPTVLLALAREPGFIPYSSELLPICLTTIALAASAYLLKDVSSRSARVVACTVTGLCIGSAPFAKLQVVPLAMTILVFAAVGIWLARRRSGTSPGIETLAAIAGLLTMPLAIAGALWVAGGWQDAWISYIKASLSYVTYTGSYVDAAFFFTTTLSYAAFLIPSVLVIMSGIALLCRLRGSTSRSVLLFLSSLLLLFVSVFVIYAPRKPISHYLLFSVVPLGCCLAGVLELMQDSWRSNRHESSISTFYLALFILPALGIAFASPNIYVRDLRQHITSAPTEPGKAIARHAGRGDRIIVWGWRPEFYVETGTIMATRDGQTGQQILLRPFQEYFRERFMKDLRAHPPKVIVDATGPGAFFFDQRRRDGIECFPAFAEFVSQHYVLKEDGAEARVFAAKEP